MASHIAPLWVIEWRADIPHPGRTLSCPARCLGPFGGSTTNPREPSGCRQVPFSQGCGLQQLRSCIEGQMFSVCVILDAIMVRGP